MPLFSYLLVCFFIILLYAFPRSSSACTHFPQSPPKLPSLPTVSSIFFGSILKPFHLIARPVISSNFSFLRKHVISPLPGFLLCIIEFHQSLNCNFIAIDFGL
ncbi:hypothetical protein L6164_024200 [Bauhinia variegata]|uniref:Uncharacterized protein n=1 Tax=Bauhinia variegata TaxID=167791 RepID=A0ACB9LWV2_BAUVA|nr:hypothetical protein L6164_024200 [Bauhinia variegata]